MGRYLDLIRGIAADPEREISATTETTFTTKGGLRSYKSFLSYSENCAADGVLEAPAATRPYPQSAIPKLSPSVADSTTETTKTTKVASFSTTKDATLSSAPAEGWATLLAERAANWGLARSRGEAERLAWAELQNRWHMEQGERIPRDICAGCRRPIGSAETLDLVDGNRVHLLGANNCLIQHGERWRAAATRALTALGLLPPATGESQ